MTYGPKNPKGPEAAKKALDKHFSGERRFKKKEPDPETLSGLRLFLLAIAIMALSGPGVCLFNWLFQQFFTISFEF